ncbi:MAG: histidine phosphatase family protein [Christensenellales bacterium]|jgi:broad specificity phosphatase PhoE
MKLYIARHAETEWNALRRTQGMTDIDLNDRGRVQADALARKALCIKPEHIYSSPLKRAYNTACPAAKALGIDIKTDADIIEYNFGAWEGKTLDEIRRTYPGQLERYDNDPLTAGIDGAEPFSALRERCKRFLNKMIDTHAKDTVLVITHSLIAKLIVAWVMKRPDSEARLIRLDNASITLIEYDGDELALAFSNDISHLEEIV